MNGTSILSFVYVEDNLWKEMRLLLPSPLYDMMFFFLAEIIGWFPTEGRAAPQDEEILKVFQASRMGSELEKKCSTTIPDLR